MIISTSQAHKFSARDALSIDFWSIDVRGAGMSPVLLPALVVFRPPLAGTITPIADADDPKVAVEDLVMEIVLMRHAAELWRGVERDLVDASM